MENNLMVLLNGLKLPSPPPLFFQIIWTTFYFPAPTSHINNSISRPWFFPLIASNPESHLYLHHRWQHLISLNLKYGILRHQDCWVRKAEDSLLELVVFSASTLNRLKRPSDGAVMAHSWTGEYKLILLTSEVGEQWNWVQTKANMEFCIPKTTQGKMALFRVPKPLTAPSPSK